MRSTPAVTALHGRCVRVCPTISTQCSFHPHTVPPRVPSPLHPDRCLPLVVLSSSAPSATDGSSAAPTVAHVCDPPARCIALTRCDAFPRAHPHNPREGDGFPGHV